MKRNNNIIFLKTLENKIKALEERIIELERINLFPIAKTVPPLPEDVEDSDIIDFNIINQYYNYNDH